MFLKQGKVEKKTSIDVLNCAQAIFVSETKISIHTADFE